MITYEVLKLESLKQIGVPHKTFIVDFYILVGLVNLINFITSLFKSLLCTIDSSISLHVSLHLLSDLGCLKNALLSSQVFDLRNRALSCIFGQLGLSLSWLVMLFSSKGSCTTENNQIK